MYFVVSKCSIISENEIWYDKERQAEDKVNEK